ncbi:pantoate--beta-alanine ligase [bacterium]|nr:pantoate--beta-alanine ligase [bacterium]
MKIIKTIDEMQNLAKVLKREGKSIGFVPTMGYLHEGHLSLIRAARAKTDVVVVSIYVNPTQFSPNEDLDAYPRDFETDRILCENEGTDIIFCPRDGDMYHDGYSTYVEVENLTKHLCGASRPEHFRGVTTIVTKLFNIVMPDIAVFGQKDGQQALVIKRMVDDLNLPVEIIVSPTVRESDGLAMSSRNKYLTPEQRKNSPLLYKALKLAEKLVLKDGVRSSAEIIDKMLNLFHNIPGMKIDYISIVDTNSVQPVSEINSEVMIALAVFVGAARLIDNIILKPDKEV